MGEDDLLPRPLRDAVWTWRRSHYYQSTTTTTTTTRTTDKSNAGLLVREEERTNSSKSYGGGGKLWNYVPQAREWGAPNAVSSSFSEKTFNDASMTTRHNNQSHPSQTMQQQQQTPDNNASLWTPPPSSGRTKEAAAGAASDAMSMDSNRTSSSSNTIAPWANRTLTIVVLLRGELCNHFMVLAQAKRMQRYIEHAIPGISCQLVGQHQANSKWKRAASDLQRCFPAFRDFEFSGGSHDPEHFEPVQQAQRQWLTAYATASGTSTLATALERQLHDVTTPSQLELLRDLLQQQYQAQQQQQYQAQPYKNSTSGAIPLPSAWTSHSSPNDSYYSIPYLTATEFVPRHAVLQSAALYHELRTWFRLDQASSSLCCRARPYPDETVFHFRNFVTEIRRPDIRRAHDFVELSPHDTAHALLLPAPTTTRNRNNHTNHTHHHSPRVAILSRFPHTATPYVQALQQVGWQVRLLEHQTGVQDFCFAVSAQHTLVGLEKSTYTTWAGLLGQAATVRWYRIDQQNNDNPNQKNKQNPQSRVPVSSSSFHNTNNHNNNNQTQTLVFGSNHLSTTTILPVSNLLQERTLIPVDPLLSSPTALSSSSSSLSSESPPQRPRAFYREVYRQSDPMTTESLQQESNALKHTTTRARPQRHRQQL